MTEAQGRYEIFQVAYSQLNAHYLPGAWGGVPGGAAELSRSVNLLKNKKWDSLAICGASNSCGRCYGRWAALGGKGYLFQPNTSRLKRLKDWVAANQPYPIEGWPPFDGYGQTPRRLGGDGSAIAMGEDCRGRRHFDCIGFIFWVLNQVVPNDAWTRNVIPQYEAGFDVLQRLGKIDRSKLLNGDIVTRTSTSPKHIGIANEDGWVVHASREGEGVKYEPYEKGNWTNVSRVASRLF